LVSKHHGYIRADLADMPGIYLGENILYGARARSLGNLKMGGG
jgi:hypothetical protein